MAKSRIYNLLKLTIAPAVLAVVVTATLSPATTAFAENTAAAPGADAPGQTASKPEGEGRQNGFVLSTKARTPEEKAARKAGDDEMRAFNQGVDERMQKKIDDGNRRLQQMGPTRSF